MGKFLGNLFARIPSEVFETSSDGSIVKKVYDPNGKEILEDVPESQNSGGGLFAFISSLFLPTPFNNNGREYNPDTGNWEYENTASAESKTIWEKMGASENAQVSDGDINMD